jgi:uncharacterized protein with PQ loop repeat
MGVWRVSYSNIQEFFFLIRDLRPAISVAGRAMAGASAFATPSPLANSCAPVSRLGVEAIVVGSVLAVVTLIVPIPQARKVVQNKSSAGVSVPTLLLTVLFGSANLGSTVAVKWRTIESCRTDGAACMAGLLDVLQQVASAVTWTVTLFCVLAYPPANVRRNAVPTLALLLVSCAIIGSSIAVAVSHPCSDASLDLAEALGWLGACCAVVQFAPQLYATCTKGSSGSLSYATYLLMAIGGAAVATNQIAFQRDTWPVSGGVCAEHASLQSTRVPLPLSEVAVEEAPSCAGLGNGAGDNVGVVSGRLDVVARWR